MAQIGQSEARPHADPHPIVVAKQFAKLNHDFDIGPSVQVKQMGHWSLNWIECCPHGCQSVPLVGLLAVHALSCCAEKSGCAIRQRTQFG